MSYSFDEILDIQLLEDLFSKFSEATGYPVCLFGVQKDELIVGTGWRKICADFHKQSECSIANCIEARRKNAESIASGKNYVIGTCANGMIEGCAPIIVEGMHLANLCTGQVFFNKPDKAYFLEQARTFGYNKDEYLEALSEVPIVTLESFEKVLLFLSRQASLIGSMGLSNISCEENKKAINEQKALLDSLINSIPDIFFYKDKEGVYQGINKAFEEYLGVKQKDVIGKTDFDIFPRDIANHFVTCDKNTLKIQKPLRIEETVMAPQGNEVLLDTLKTPYMSIDGTLVGLIGVARDITAQRNAQERSFQSSKLESLGLLAGGIAHDFNNALTSVLGNLELALEETYGQPKTAELLTQARQSVLRSRKLTTKLLTFAEGGMPIQKEANLSEVIRDSAQFALTGSSVRLTLDTPDNLWKGNIDREQVSQVIHNLVVNARQAMNDSGEVLITCENNTTVIAPESESKGFVKILISDTGPGIEEQNRDKIFDPYFTTSDRRCGLGLTTCHSIIEKHKGYISLVQTPARGATFELLFPAIEEQRNQTTTPTIPPGQPSHSIDNTQGQPTGRILIMDDEPSVAKVTQKMLERFGYSVEAVTNGEEALVSYTRAMEDQTPFQLVIMDLTIVGGMGGKEAIARLLKIDPHANVIVASGYSTDPVMASYKDFGFNASLSKPFEMAELKTTVSQLLSKNPQNPYPKS